MAVVTVENSFQGAHAEATSVCVCVCWLERGENPLAPCSLQKLRT